MKSMQAAALAAVFAFGTALGAAGQTNWIPASAEAVAKWQDLRFGMFIHWGPVSLTGHEIGWSRGKETPVETYDKLVLTFNPTNFDADAWAATAKAAGMKYVVLTTKHHDGFCLWPSDLTDYDIAAGPFRRDIVGELAAACRKQGLLFGTYYSVCDWWHRDFPKGSPGGKTEKPDAVLDRYVEYYRGQVRELVTRYGPLVSMWFDVPQVVGPTQGLPTVKMLRELQPDIIINNRAFSGAPGDHVTPEQRVGGFDMERPWETCMTICRQWSWKPDDKMKSREECIQTLVRTVGGNGNLLFNVGPMPDGRIEPRQVDRLKEMGDWVARHAEAVYETRGGPYKPGAWGASTRRGSSVYLHIMKWDGDAAVLPRLPAKVKSATLLTAKGTADVAQSDTGLVVRIDAALRDAAATVVKLEIEGDSMVLEPIATASGGASLTTGAKATASNVFQKSSRYGAAMAVDGEPETRWAADAGTKQAWLEVDLRYETEISKAVVQEWEGDRGRIRKLEIRVKDGDEWKTVAAADTAAKPLTFPAVKARYIRLEILDAKDGPTVEEFHLMK